MASSRVGESTSAEDCQHVVEAMLDARKCSRVNVGIPCVSLTAVSMTCKMLMLKVAVLPVPLCACAIVSRPLQICTMARDWTAEGDS